MLQNSGMLKLVFILPTSVGVELWPFILGKSPGPFDLETKKAADRDRFFKRRSGVRFIT